MKGRNLSKWNNPQGKKQSNKVPIQLLSGEIIFRQVKDMGTHYTASYKGGSIKVERGEVLQGLQTYNQIS